MIERLQSYHKTVLRANECVIEDIAEGKSSESRKEQNKNLQDLRRWLSFAEDRRP